MKLIFPFSCRNFWRMLNSLLDDGVESERAKFPKKNLREFEFIIDEKKHNYRIKTRDVCFLNSTLCICKAEVANFFSVAVKILKRNLIEKSGEFAV